MAVPRWVAGLLAALVLLLPHGCWAKKHNAINCYVGGNTSGPRAVTIPYTLQNVGPMKKEWFQSCYAMEVYINDEPTWKGYIWGGSELPYWACRDPDQYIFLLRAWVNVRGGFKYGADYVITSQICCDDHQQCNAPPGYNLTDIPFKAAAGRPQRHSLLGLLALLTVGGLLVLLR